MIIIYGAQDTDKKYTCDNCFKNLITVGYYTGFVYFLSNKSMPGYIKIGCTSRDVYERANELGRATAVPEPFEIEAYFLSKNHEKDEQRVHNILSSFKVKNKEFFRIEIEKAIEKTKEYLIDIQVKTSNPKKPSNSPLLDYSQNCIIERNEQQSVPGEPLETFSANETTSERKNSNNFINKYYVDKEVAPPPCFGQRLRIKNVKEKGCMMCPHEIACMRAI